MNFFTIPWKCLDLDTIEHIPEKTKPKTAFKPQKSFAQALNSNVCDIPFSQLPKPVIKGDLSSIEIPEDEYEACLEDCKHNLHGRIIWPKGSTPLTVVALRKKLSAAWKDLGRWGVSFIGKGYYEFCFSNVEDLRRVRSVGSWNLAPGLLRLFANKGF